MHAFAASPPGRVPEQLAAEAQHDGSMPLRSEQGSCGPWATLRDASCMQHTSIMPFDQFAKLLLPQPYAFMAVANTATNRPM